MRDDAEADAHLVLYLQGSQQGTEGLEAEFALFEHRVTADDQPLGGALVANQHVELMRRTAHPCLHASLHRALRRLRRRKPHGAQHDLGVVLRIQQCRSEHVAPCALARRLRHLGWKIRARLCAQFSFVYAQTLQRHMHLEAALQRRVRRVEDAAERVRGDDVIVPGGGEGAALVDPDGQERLAGHDRIGRAEVRRYAWDRLRGGGRADARRRRASGQQRRARQQRQPLQ